MIEEQWIREHVCSDRFYFSRHGDQERQNDNLTLVEVKQAMVRGVVLEHYGDTGRGESCLMVGFTDEGKPLHCVCGRRGDWLVFVTVYIPTPPKFRNPFERGETT